MSNCQHAIRSAAVLAVATLAACRAAAPVCIDTPVGTPSLTAPDGAGCAELTLDPGIGVTTCGGATGPAVLLRRGAPGAWSFGIVGPLPFAYTLAFQAGEACNECHAEPYMTGPPGDPPAPWGGEGGSLAYFTDEALVVVEPYSTGRMVVRACRGLDPDLGPP